MKQEILIYLLLVLVLALFVGFEWMLFLINRLNRIKKRIQLISFGVYLGSSFKNKPRPWVANTNKNFTVRVGSTFWLQLGIVFAAIFLLIILCCICWDFAALTSWKINRFS